MSILLSRGMKVDIFEKRLANRLCLALDLLLSFGERC